MSFLTEVTRLESFDIEAALIAVTRNDVEKSLERHSPDAGDLIHFLSPAAEGLLEEMAQKASDLTCRHFGRTIGLYAPLYISDFCTNHCTYCGFHAQADFRRKRLSTEEIEIEGRAIAATGIRHILLLTGEAPAVTPLSYLTQAISVLKPHFSSIALEMFPMDEEDYRSLIRAGADSLTIYQETYDRALYREVHVKGRKADYAFRLATPERGARAGFRAINIGPLFGLGRPRPEAFLSALHARYLEHHFPDVEISLSLPRMRKASQGIEPKNILSDTGFVQIMLAWRLFMPRMGITISTREPAAFRDRLIHLGATRYSAGSRTDVGGYAHPASDAVVQFEVTDERSVSQIVAMIRQSGFEPVFKDWERAL